MTPPPLPIREEKRKGELERERSKLAFEERERERERGSLRELWIICEFGFCFGFVGGFQFFFFFGLKIDIFKFYGVLVGLPRKFKNIWESCHKFFFLNLRNWKIIFYFHFSFFIFWIKLKLKNKNYFYFYFYFFNLENTDVAFFNSKNSDVAFKIYQIKYFIIILLAMSTYNMSTVRSVYHIWYFYYWVASRD